MIVVHMVFQLMWTFCFCSSKLVINQIIPEDDAVYQCMAESSQGSAMSRARLTVVMSEDRPSAPRNLQAETMSSSAIILSWERPLYNSEKVIAYSVHYMKAEGKNKWIACVYEKPIDFWQLFKAFVFFFSKIFFFCRTTLAFFSGMCYYIKCQCTNVLGFVF